MTTPEIEGAYDALVQIAEPYLGPGLYEVQTWLLREAGGSDEDIVRSLVESTEFELSEETLQLSVVAGNPASAIDDILTTDLVFSHRQELVPTGELHSVVQSLVDALGRSAIWKTNYASATSWHSITSNTFDKLIVGRTNDVIVCFLRVEED